MIQLNKNPCNYSCNSRVSHPHFQFSKMGAGKGTQQLIGLDDRLGTFDMP